MQLNDPNTLAHHMLRRANDMFNTFHQKYIAVAKKGKKWDDRVPVRQSDKHRIIVSGGKAAMVAQFLQSPEWKRRVDELASEGAQVSVEIDAVLVVPNVDALINGTTLARALAHTGLYSTTHGFSTTSGKIALRIVVKKHPTYAVKLPRGVTLSEQTEAA